VREDLREHLGNPGEELLYFERSGVYRAEGLHVEHGNQYFEDSFFGNFTHPFLRDGEGQLRLERCWGNCFLMYFAASMREKNPFVDNVKPITSLVWMGLQEESFPFKLRHAYKLVNFILRALLREPEAPGEALEGTQPDVNAPIGRKGQLVLDPLATREDVLSLKARELLLEEKDVDVVVFGHDHRYYSNELFPSLDGKKGKYYINTGSERLYAVAHLRRGASFFRAYGGGVERPDIRIPGSTIEFYGGRTILQRITLWSGGGAAQGRRVYR